MCGSGAASNLECMARDHAETAAPELHDPSLPAMGDLLDAGGGTGAHEFLAVAAGALGFGAGMVRGRTVQASWRPGRSLAVRYQVRVADGEHERDEVLVAYTGAELPVDAIHLDGPHGRVALWRLADDPWLPGLHTALDPIRVRELLASLGVPAAPVHLRLRAYRVGRRAVVEVETGAHRFFLKVVRPDRIARLQKRHQVLEPLLPVPLSHGWSDAAGLVVLQAMDGMTLREGLERLDEPVPDPTQLGALLDRLPAIEDQLRPRSTIQSALGHISLLSYLAPTARNDLDRLRVAFETEERAAPIQPRRAVPIHGDFHESQLLILGGAISALLDVDTVTLGDRADDWARLIAHLDQHQLQSSGDIAERIRAYRDHTRAVAAGDTASTYLRVRIAAAALGLATGPFRVQSSQWPSETRERIVRAVAWLDGHEDAPRKAASNELNVAAVVGGDEKSLIADSEPSHPRTTG